MTTSLTVALNVVLDVAIVVGILSVLRWGMRAQIRDMKAMSSPSAGSEATGGGLLVRFRLHAERRHAQRRERGPLTA